MHGDTDARVPVYFNAIDIAPLAIAHASLSVAERVALTQHDTPVRVAISRRIRTLTQLDST